MNQLPDNVLLKIFSYINWQKRIIFESVSKRWENILLDNKSLRYVGSVNLNALVRMNANHLIPGAIQSFVKKRKIIDEIIADTNDIAHVIQPVMQTITSVEPVGLTRLSIKLLGLANVFSCNPMISLCINLQVLELTHEEVEFDEEELERYPTVDLSGLVNLTHLTGEWIHFLNCRSQVLRVLDYDQAFNVDNVEGKIDFVQMILSASPSIEVLCLTNIVIEGGSVVQPDVICTMPKLKVFKIAETNLSDLIVNLAESTDLHELYYSDWECAIINLDLSICCLTSIDVQTHIPFSVVEQFVSSSITHPYRLCLLEKLHLEFEIAQLLLDFFSCISNIYTYSFRYFKVEFYEYFDEDDVSPESVSLVTLARCCPHLVSLDLIWFCIDMQCLIDIITIKVNVECFSDFKFKGIDGSGLNFLSCLNNSLSCIDPPIIKRKKTMNVTLGDRNNYWLINITVELNDLRCEIEQKFNIKIN